MNSQGKYPSSGSVIGYLCGIISRPLSEGHVERCIAWALLLVWDQQAEQRNLQHSSALWEIYQDKELDHFSNEKTHLSSSHLSNVLSGKKQNIILFYLMNALKYCSRALLGWSFCSIEVSDYIKKKKDDGKTRL